MANLILNGSTSGSVTLSSPAVSGTTTLTLPATTGTVLTTTSPKAGNVIQVVNATTSTGSSTTSTSFVASNLTASITPTSSSSKILVLVGGFGYATALNYAYYTIARGTTVLSSGSSGLSALYNNDGSVPISMFWLDSPATTSSTSYTAYFKRGASGTAYFIENINGTGVITLMEIAG